MTTELTDDEVADLINEIRTPISILMSKDGIFLIANTRRWPITAVQAEVVMRCMHARTA